MRKNNTLFIVILSLTGFSVASLLALLELVELIPFMVLHTMGLALALFMIATSLISYARVRSSRLLYMTLAFFAFGIMQFLNFAYGISAIQSKIPLNIEISHIFGVAILGLFTLSVMMKR